MASVEELIKEASEPDTTILEFYKSIDHILENIPLRDVYFPILHRMAVVLHSTMREEVDWMIILQELGIRDNIMIKRIKENSKLSQELPIYLALIGSLQYKTLFSDVVKVLMNCDRHDVLREIKSSVEDFIKEYNKGPVPSAPELEEENALQKSESISVNKLQNKSISKWCKKMPINILPRKHITVFLLHADADTDEANILSQQLKEEQITVRTFQDLDYLLMLDSSECIIALLKVVDFIVPIVSETFLNEIHPSNQLTSNTETFSDISSLSALNNRQVYQILFNEYLLNRCLNLRVRPVMVPNMRRELLKFDALLFYSLQLWNHVPRFVEILRKTRQKIMS